MGDSSDSKTDDKRDNKNKSTERKEVKQKVASKMVKDMGDKGRYEGENQIKTLVIIPVLGDTKTFFDFKDKYQILKTSLLQTQFQIVN